MDDPTTLIIPLFLFALGACVGSFLNVVVYRLPRDMSLISPPSTCPKCDTRLAAYDNVPVFGWLWLRGRCRYCREPISMRYPLVELVTGLLFVAHYLVIFYGGWGPYQVKEVLDVTGLTLRTYDVPMFERDWPLLVLHLWLIGALLAASLIDLEHFIIPLGLCWLTALVGAIGHGLLLYPGDLGALHFSPTSDAIAAGGGIGLLVSIALLRFGVLRRSFEDDAPPLEHDLEQVPEEARPEPWPAWRIRSEMGREILFLMPPIVCACVAAAIVMSSPGAMSAWSRLADQPNVSGLLGALMGALVGGAVVWLFRIAGSIGFGREAMGLGDVHLMFGVGAIIGPGASVIAFFLAPLFGLSIALVQLLISGKREIPYGPYLSLATYCILVLYTPIATYLSPGLEGLVLMVKGLLG